MTIRTGFSFGVAIGTVADVTSRVKDVAWDVAPITDRCSTFAYTAWSKACKAQGLRPVYGVEIGVVKEPPPPKQKKIAPDYWKFYAVDNLRPIHDLVYQATSTDAPEPILSVQQALSAPGVIAVTGERLNLDVFKDLKTLEDMPLPDHLYFGVSPSTPIGLVRAAMRRRMQPVATQDNLYPRADDRELYRVMLGDAASVRTYSQHILSIEEWHAAVAWWNADEYVAWALRNQREVLDRCCADLRRATLLVPTHDVGLRDMCVAGAAAMNVNLADPVYAERLDREIKLIEEKQFADYFYILADMIQWARERMIVGPARGSSCGSLVCYLLGITTIDPIPYNLVFERFIDVNRSDLPDVDVDFSDKLRQLAFDYIERKYGRERVARLGTVSTFQPKSALNRAGQSLRVPLSFTEEVGRVVIKRAQGDGRASQSLEDTLKTTDSGQRLLRLYPGMEIAARMEDHPSNAGQHAAGIVLTDGPVRDYVAVDARTNATMCDKADAEDLNLLKIDALGLIQLSTFERVMQLIGRRPVSGWLETLPLDDQAAFDVLNAGHFAGIFQFAPGSVLARLARDMVGMGGRFNHIEDLIALTALVRPGPLTSGETTKWVDRKTGVKPVVYPHDMLRKFLEGTFGVMVYQEQVMLICREVGGMSWEAVNVLRRAMSKSYGKEFFDKYRDQWMVGALASGLPADVADATFNDMCQFGSMAFNRAHAVAYGLISYWCCWLKAHYPVEFAAATLDAESDDEHQRIILRELNAEGVKYVPVDRARSTDKWEIATRDDGGKYLVGPLTGVVGFGPVRVRKILDGRKQGALHLGAHEERILTQPRTKIDTLWPVTEAIARLRNGNGNGGVNDVFTPIVELKPNMPFARIAGVVDKITQNDLNSLQYTMRRDGRRLSGPTITLSVVMRDDTDDIFCWINQHVFDPVGAQMYRQCRPGKSIYLFTGEVIKERRMFNVAGIHYIGELE